MLRWLLIAVAVTIGVIALLVGVLRRLNPPPRPAADPDRRD